MSEILMPRLSDTMEEGTILRWLKADGDQVARGEELVEIETDKATMTYESDLQGALQIIAAEGETLPVGAPIATVGAESAAIEEKGPASEGPAEGVGAPGPDGAPRAPGPDDGAPAPAPVQSTAAAAADGGGRVRASPLARRIASERGVDLHALHGSGPSGRIVKADVLAAGAGAAEVGAAPAQGGTGGVPTPEAIATAKGETTEVELTRTQQTIARRMAESRATIPDFTLQMDVDMEECVRLRGELKRLAHEDTAGEATPTYNDMVVKACALALREHPRANSSYRDGRLQLHSRINVGVAVAAHDALIVPTVFDAEEKSLGEIARETRMLAERVRDGSITPPELGGGTFTVSNLGMYGVRSFSAIINPPQVAIVSVGALEPNAVASEDGELAMRHTMTLTMACDHRVLYGAEAAEFLGRVRELLQSPSALTL